MWKEWSRGPEAGQETFRIFDAFYTICMASTLLSTDR